MENRELQSIDIQSLCNKVRDGDEDRVLALLSNLNEAEELGIRTDFRELTGSDKQNIAFYAAARTAEQGGAYNILKFLQEHKFPLNLVDFFNQTPLFYAAKQLNLEVCKLLIQEGCDVNKLDRNLQNVLYYAVYDNPAEKNDHNTKKRPRKDDEKKKRLRLVKFLVQKGVNWDHVDKQGYNVSWYASYELSNAIYDSVGKKRRVVKSNENPLYVHTARIKDKNAPNKIWREVKYYVDYAKTEDTLSLSKLEDEFIEDHREILSNLFDATPTFATMCGSLGLNKAVATRRNIISFIAKNKSPYKRTLKIAEQGTEEIVGYLYFTCSPQPGVHDPDKDYGLEISHLKVLNSHRRKGLGKALFEGLQNHLQREDIEEYGNDTRLSVFAENIPAVGLYERLGFKRYEESWYSPLKDAPANKFPEVEWQRYQRVKNAQVEKKPKKKRGH